jgi:hypothetical protein
VGLIAGGALNGVSMRTTAADDAMVHWVKRRTL